MQNEEFFQPEDVISTYSDREAVEDGFLVAINPRDRVTRAVWEWLVEKQPKDNRPPSCWPVGMMGWFKAAAITKTEALKMIAKHGSDGQRVYERQVRDRKAHALSIGVIDQNRDRARRVYEENTDGGTFKLHASVENDVILELGSGSVVLWLIPNENGGITLMFPEDY